MALLGGRWGLPVSLFEDTNLTAIHAKHKPLTSLCLHYVNIILSDVMMYVIKASPSAPALLTYLYLTNPRILLWLVVSGASGLKRVLGFTCTCFTCLHVSAIARLRVLTMGPWDSLIVSVQL